MRGPRILLAVLAATGLLLWSALAGGHDADLRRGIEETDRSFAAIEDTLRSLDPDYQALRSQGMLLGLGEERDLVTKNLAAHKSRRVRIETDPKLGRRERLPLLRELAAEADGTLAAAIELRRRVAVLRELRTEAAAVTSRARAHRDAIAALAPQGEAQARAASLASGLAENEALIEMAQRLVRSNTEQGELMGRGAIRTLRSIIERQEELLAELR